MHTCPDCGQACSCNGDIDDCLDICEEDSDNCEHYLECQNDDDDEDFDECCMPYNAKLS